MAKFSGLPLACGVLILLTMLALPHVNRCRSREDVFTLQMRKQLWGMGSAPLARVPLPPWRPSPSSIDNGAPMSFTLRKNATESRKVIVSHAVPVPEEGVLVFFAYHTQWTGPVSERVFSLPAAYACVYVDGLGHEYVTELEIHRAAEQLYTTTSVWKCALPPVDWNRFDSVRLVGPTENVVGDGVFPLPTTRPVGHITACTKNIFNLTRGGVMHRRLVEYVDYYSRLGVDHFVIYVVQGQEDSELLLELPNVTLVRLSPRLHAMTFGANSTAGSQKLQVYTVNDCVWRTRHNAAWTLIQFDVDEYLVGTSDLRATLGSVAANVSAVYTRHHLARLPFGTPLLRDSIQYSARATRTWGKSIVRPEKVDCMVRLPPRPV
jgi:hypothetical protein